MTASVPTPAGHCPEGWIQYGASCFLLSTKQSIPWEEAEGACQAIDSNAHLASCFTSEEVFFLTRHMRDNKLKAAYHIGIDLQSVLLFALSGLFEGLRTNYMWSSLVRNSNHDPKYLDGSELPSLMPWKDAHPSKDANRCTKMEGGLLYDQDCLSKAWYICKQGPTACTPKSMLPSLNIWGILHFTFFLQ